MRRSRSTCTAVNIANTGTRGRRWRSTFVIDSSAKTAWKPIKNSSVRTRLSRRPDRVHAASSARLQRLHKLLRIAEPDRQQRDEHGCGVHVVSAPGARLRIGQPAVPLAFDNERRCKREAGEPDETDRARYCIGGVDHQDDEAEHL